MYGFLIPVHALILSWLSLYFDVLVMNKTIKSTFKTFEVKDGKSTLFDETGKPIAKFDGKLQEVCNFLFLIKGGILYDIVETEDKSFVIKPYQGYSLI